MTFRVVSNPPLGDMPVIEPRADAIAAAVHGAILPAPGADALKSRLAAPGAVTVTTGQQPALFLGPLYTLYKAASAAALAARLEERWGRPVVPVFWLGGDDHDWDEARVAHWLDADGELVTGMLRERPPSAPMTPLWREPLGPEVAELVRQFRTMHEGLVAGGFATDLLQRHFEAGRTISAAAGGMLAELLAPLGVLVLDSTEAGFKRAMAPVLLHAVADRAELSRRLLERAEGLRKQGRAPGVDHEADATLVMLDGPEGRDRIVAADRQLRLRRSGAIVRMDELERIAGEQPERLSPNVLLRPAVESQLLASVAYCAGPGELRYLALATSVFRHLGIAQPARVPRWSGLLVDSYADRMLARFGLSLEALRDPERDVLSQAAADRMPGRAVGALKQLRAVAAEAGHVLTTESASIAEPLARSADGSMRRIEFEVGRLERRMIRALKRRHDTELRQLRRARTSVLPAGRPQERVLCVPEPLARYGPALLEAVRDEAASAYRQALEGPHVPA